MDSTEVIYFEKLVYYSPALTLKEAECRLIMAPALKSAQSIRIKMQLHS
jgi:hypothetical protein